MQPFLEFQSVTKRFNRVDALRDISFSIERGRVLALLGPNGAGKSTLFGCFLGITIPTGGKILLNGKMIADADRAAIGYVAERVALYPQRTVIENADFFTRLKGHSSHEAEEQLKRVGMSGARDRKIRQLSKGMLQRLGLAIALCGQPEILVLDEPFNGLDPALLDVLQGILREENERGATLLISTHTMSAVEPLATDAAILLRGKLAAFGALEKLRAENNSADSLEDIYYQIARGQYVTEEMFA
ncbi:MAG TPA: ABC transporter ATP-binding protein [Verrucomicrobiae bacterium]|nr:ABC transporter ATP-binding protein [Verrucomicrobiae bacterium]